MKLSWGQALMPTAKVGKLGNPNRITSSITLLSFVSFLNDLRIVKTELRELTTRTNGYLKEVLMTKIGYFKY